MVSKGECGRFEMAQNVQCGEGIVLLRKAFDMLLLEESLSAKDDEKVLQRVSNPMQDMCTVDFRLIGSIVAKSFPCARIEVRRNVFRTVDGLGGERSIIEHRDIRTWARRRVA